MSFIRAAQQALPPDAASPSLRSGQGCATQLKRERLGGGSTNGTYLCTLINMIERRLE